MANETQNKAPFKVIATTSSRVKELPIENGQVIFVQDKTRIAFDFNDQRKFYNQINELATERDRVSLSSPSSGYYFIIETAVLWKYEDEWIRITNPPTETVFIGVELPELGQEQKLYVNTSELVISVWDEGRNDYIVVSDKTMEVTDEDIQNLFS